MSTLFGVISADLMQQVMSRIGASGGSSRVSLVEADVAIKAFRTANGPTEAQAVASLIALEGTRERSGSQSIEREMELGDNLTDFEMAARCDEAELRAMGTQAALEVHPLSLAGCLLHCDCSLQLFVCQTMHYHCSLQLFVCHTLHYHCSLQLFVCHTVHYHCSLQLFVCHTVHYHCSLQLFVCHTVHCDSVCSQASEQQLTHLMSEREQLNSEIEHLRGARESEVQSSCFAIEELQDELQDAIEGYHAEKTARERDAER